MVLVTFAVVNRGPVTIDFWPLPMDMQAPLSAMIMLSLIVGVIWGGVASWLAAGTGRKRKTLRDDFDFLLDQRDRKIEAARKS